MLLFRAFALYSREIKVKMTDKRTPLILVSNDDGYQANGIRSLINAINDLGEIIVCAPDGARSGYSRAFTASSILRLRPRGKMGNANVWSCNGTPVDCVKLALGQLCVDRKPDIIIGGINHGDNASVNAHYSGTVGVAVEGCMKGIPSVAFSLCDHHPDADFSPLTGLMRQVVSRVLDEGLPKGVFLNVNFPLAKTFKGVRVCRMAHGLWDNECVKMRHPLGFDFFWLLGEYTNLEPSSEDTDHQALEGGYVAITPTTIDLTAYEAMERIKGWEF